LHPTAHRLLTLRECARIQTFPDSFGFLGTASDRALLIGNAVPPRLARAVADSLIADLATARSDEGDGSLLSFVPTLADAMSPALARATDLVAHRFAPPTGPGDALRLWA
jgi:DNA (cytosine-5)-methyltransferase 1